jgi:hypothetical protein
VAFKLVSAKQQVQGSVHAVRKSKEERARARIADDAGILPY